MIGALVTFFVGSLASRIARPQGPDRIVPGQMKAGIN
jgi:hypothetical protein